MFPFTPHTTLRPNYCSGGSLCILGFTLHVNYSATPIALKDLSNYRYQGGKIAWFYCDKIFSKVSNNIAKDFQACQQPRKLQILLLSKKY